jgi:selenocysteine-specific elongation factor
VVIVMLRDRATTIVDQFHKANPLVAGIGREQLRETIALPEEVFRGVLESLVRDKKLQVSGEVVQAFGKGVVLRDEEAEAKAQIEQAFAKSGLKVPLLKDVLAALPVDKVRAQKIVTLLLRDRVLVKLGDELVFHRDALAGLKQQVAAQKSKTSKLNVGSFKDLFGITRKHAIPLLEYLDRERVTRRMGDERVIL